MRSAVRRVCSEAMARVRRHPAGVRPPSLVARVLRVTAGDPTRAHGRRAAEGTQVEVRGSELRAELAHERLGVL
jgi:hypothetical protein